MSLTFFTFWFTRARYCPYNKDSKSQPAYSSSLFHLCLITAISIFNKFLCSTCCSFNSIITRFLIKVGLSGMGLSGMGRFGSGPFRSWAFLEVGRFDPHSEIRGLGQKVSFRKEPQCNQYLQHIYIYKWSTYITNLTCF